LDRSLRKISISYLPSPIIAVQNKLNLYFKIKKRYTQTSFQRTLARHSCEGRNQVALDLYFCFRKSGMILQKEEMLSLKKEMRLYFRGSSILYRQSLDSSVRWNDGNV